MVHYALCAEIELEHGAVEWSFACRRGKGVLSALRHVQRLARQHPYVLKLDARHFLNHSS
ncbi:MAG: hypothetical protein GXP62_00795 [Oligoflexia bacterium]|nr:hypothetical protein [Oligoflexia bacterium]